MLAAFRVRGVGVERRAAAEDVLEHLEGAHAEVEVLAFQGIHQRRHRGLAVGQKLGRRFIGIEIEERYFDIACRRIEAAMAQPDLFVTTPEPKPEQLSLLGAAE